MGACPREFSTAKEYITSVIGMVFDRQLGVIDNS